jgi:hypothetical protein
MEVVIEQLGGLLERLVDVCAAAGREGLHGGLRQGLPSLSDSDMHACDGASRIRRLVWRKKRHRRGRPRPQAVPR